MPGARIAALNVYPVKSCRGLSLAGARVAVRGLVAGIGADAVWDREWLVIDPGGRFVTQRETPRLALIATSIEGGALKLTAPDRPALEISLAPLHGPTRDVVVWSSVIPARDAGDEAAAWLTSTLGRDVRMVRFDPRHQRLCNPEWAGESGAHTAFADGYPLLVIGEASLEDLNDRLGDRDSPALPMNRFRPNIVLSGLDAYDEDHIDTLSADGVVMKLVKPCARCQITTTDQDSGRVGVEPLQALGAYRMNERVGGVTFGMNAIVVGGQGRTLSVGTGVEASFAF
jgi:uncharacterized protein YcbX